MNGKKAKQLRREADRVTVGMADVAYTSDTIQKKIMVIQTNPQGLPEPTERLVSMVTLLLQGNCTRKVYKTLKKAYKQINNSRRSVYA